MDSSKDICTPVSDFDPVMVLHDAAKESGSLLSMRVRKENSDKLPGWAVFISVNRTFPRRKKASMQSSEFHLTLSRSIAFSSSDLWRERKWVISSCRGLPSDR